MAHWHLRSLGQDLSFEHVSTGRRHSLAWRRHRTARLRAEVLRKFREAGQRTPLELPFKPSMTLAVKAAFGKPSPQFIGADRPIFLLISADDFIHRCPFVCRLACRSLSPQAQEQSLES